MAKGFKKDGLEIFSWEIFRGAGRQTGRDISRQISKQVKKRVLDDSSSHRRLVDRFVLPGNFKGSIQKMYGLIDSFYNEYITTNAILQGSFYLQDDIYFIERKIEFTKRLIFSEAEERAYDRLVDTWSEYKELAIKRK